MASGKWSGPETWEDGSVPDDDARVQVAEAVTVTVASELAVLGACVVLPVVATVDPVVAAIAAAVSMGHLGGSVPRTLAVAALFGVVWRSFVG